jgi:non-homologous end joining protein Ku
MGYTLRYAEELLDSKECFPVIEEHAIDERHLALAGELIHAQTAPFDLRDSVMVRRRHSVNESKRQEDLRRPPSSSLQPRKNGPALMTPRKRAHKVA